MQNSRQKMNEKKNSNTKVQTQAQRNKRPIIQNDQQQLILLTDCLKLIDSLYEMRFIQKISRPVEKRVKDQYVEKFAGKMESLHSKLERIKIQITERNQYQNGNAKGRSVLGSATHRPLDWKKTIRSIENKYIQVLIEGSFKHYGKLLQLNSFIYPLKTINIEQWALQCLNQQSKQSSCC